MDKQFTAALFYYKMFSHLRGYNLNKYILPEKYPFGKRHANFKTKDVFDRKTLEEIGRVLPAREYDKLIEMLDDLSVYDDAQTKSRDEVLKEVDEKLFTKMSDYRKMFFSFSSGELDGKASRCLTDTFPVLSFLIEGYMKKCLDRSHQKVGLLQTKLETVFKQHSVSALYSSPKVVADYENPDSPYLSIKVNLTIEDTVCLAYREALEFFLGLHHKGMRPVFYDKDEAEEDEEREAA